MRKGKTMRKRKMKILVILGCILGILLSINIVHADGLRLSRSKIQLLVGEKATIKSIPGNSKVRWSSSNPRIVSVNYKGKNGSLKAKNSGKVTITAKYKGKRAKCTVTVKRPVVNRNAIKGFWVIDTQTTMAKNGTSMFRIYGTGFKYGSEMNFTSNGKFNYYAGIGNGGKGSYQIGSKDITYQVICYEDNSLEKGHLSVSKKKGLRLVMKYGTYKIYWKKK